MTKQMRRLWEASIWHPDAIPESEGVASRELKRLVLPIFDGFVAGMGFGGMILGMPSIAEVWAVEPSQIAGFVLMIAGLTAFVGIVFPKFWVAEAIGKLLMLLVIGGYAVALWVLTFQGVGTRWVVAFAFTALLALPFWNIARLGREWHKRRVMAEVMRRHLQEER